jgi:hypothetical protein
VEVLGFLKSEGFRNRFMNGPCKKMSLRCLQMGDYSASAFYRFAKRGHRFKCWECGVKKKAPCGDTERSDLPWCCHRRLGTYLPIITASKASPNSNTKYLLQGQFPPIVLYAVSPKFIFSGFALCQVQCWKISLLANVLLYCS